MWVYKIFPIYILLMLRLLALLQTPSVISNMRRVKREPAVTALKMELLGKRFWLWNASEWAFDKFVALTQVRLSLVQEYKGTCLLIVCVILGKV